MSEQDGCGDFAHTVSLHDTLDRILRDVETVDEGSAVDTKVENSSAESVSASASAAGSPLGSLLGGLMANPALLSAIPTLMENLGPLLRGGGKGSGAKPSSPSLDRHTALLCAVKPYLGSERQEAAEKIIRLCRAWDALEKSGMSDLLRGFSSAMPRNSGINREQEDDYVQ